MFVDSMWEVVAVGQAFRWHKSGDTANTREGHAPHEKQMSRAGNGCAVSETGCAVSETGCSVQETNVPFKKRNRNQT